MFPGLRAEDLPGGEAWGAERLTMTAHNGTHIDAPWRYASTQDDGKPALTIDQVPLEWCFQPGVKLDFRRFLDGYVATAGDVEAELKRIGHELQPLEQLPASGFWISCFPYKIERGSAGFIRAVAFLPV